MSKQKLYLECYSGISGDMMVASLLDLGADEEVLKETLKTLPLDGFDIKISRVSKAGLDACDFDVVLDQENHDHDMEYLHGYVHNHNHVYDYTHDHGHDHDHCHDHDHNHDHDHSHNHVHRGLPDVLYVIRESDMTERAKKTAEKIFDILANAESKAHGLPKNKVHFHEVGAVDSIVDIAAVAICLDNLNISEVIIPTLYEGSGTVRCQHGILPIPVPAVTNIVNAENLTLHITETKGEFVTPTGAAIAAAIRTSEQLPENFNIIKTGVGAGKRNYERPSLLRAMFIEEKEDSLAEKDEIIKMESNIDDCTGEALGYVMDQLMAAGARDVHYFPVFMKKNRPGYQLNVICKENQMEELQRIIFRETTSIGIRIQRMERSILPRKIEIRNTSMGPVQVKICDIPGGQRVYPEHDSIVSICKTTGRTWQDVYRQILKECE